MTANPYFPAVVVAALALSSLVSCDVCNVHKKLLPSYGRVIDGASTKTLPNGNTAIVLKQYYGRIINYEYDPRTDKTVSFHISSADNFQIFKLSETDPLAYHVEKNQACDLFDIDGLLQVRAF